ncbi:MAG: hypothetical protein A3F68_09140 [Acidobacteria bacterium RIFCSPLOWO2_12_FULL_54_10]|nr:MAG: hypothetical protein A3F68_09140 [Acidobacteria bacterium RIFCSPLOWO2_12_FULL_54_10]
MRGNLPERGALTVSAIISLLFVVVIIFAALRLLPPYINNFQFQNALDDLARTVTYNKISENDIRSAVISQASEIGIELDPSQVTVSRGSGTVNIAVQYEIPVDLLVREVVLEFDPAAGNQLITKK